MATTYTSTGTISNLTRLELEQLRRADSATSGKALTVGDSAYGSENVVGKGNVNAEPFQSKPFMALGQLANVTPPGTPGTGLSTTTHVWGVDSETVSWVGPTLVWDGNEGGSTDGNWWIDFMPGGPPLDWTTIAQAGDIVLVKTQTATMVGSGLNNYAVGLVDSVNSGGVHCTTIYNPSNVGDTTHFSADPANQHYTFSIIRPNAVQLLALPGSGPTGREQSFLMVKPGSTLHSSLGPTLDQINADRVTNIVPPNFALDSTVDRADAVFAAPAPFSTLNKLGYRVVLYPDNGNANPALRGPDLSRPIATLNPVIDSNIPLADQRMTIDFQAGVIRFSCAPNTGSDIKPSVTCVNGTTGRLNLYAVFWAADSSLTQGTARGLYVPNSTETAVKAPARMVWDSVKSRWLYGSRDDLFAAYVKASAEDPSLAAFGVSGLTPPGSSTGYYYDSYFGIRANGPWYWANMTNTGMAPVFNPWFSNGQSIDQTPRHFEVNLGVKDGLTMGDNSNPPARVGLDQYPSTNTIFAPLGKNAQRNLDWELMGLLSQAATSPVGRVKLFKGRYKVNFPVHVPPGVTLEGEGNQTVIESFNTTGSPVLKFGPNTPWGVYDFDWNGGYGSMSAFTTNVQTKVEGMDIVWNSNKRVWGIAWADLTANAVWFNEMRTDGTFVYPGFGVNLLVQTTNNPGPTSFLWSSDFTGMTIDGSTHTPGHYPRIDYSPEMGSYAATWVQLDAARSGPEVRVVQFSVGEYDPLVPEPAPSNVTVPPTITWHGTSGKEGIILGAPTHEWTDHPSVKYARSGALYIVCWSRIWNPVTDSHIRTDVWDASANTHSTYTGSNIRGGLGVITSTDIALNPDDSGLVAWSEHAHKLLTGVAGQFGGTFNSWTFFQTSSGIGDIAEASGSKLHYLGVPGFPANGAGFDFSIADRINSDTFYVHYENSIDKTITAGPAGALKWAISPRCTIKVAPCTNLTASVEVTANTNPNDHNTYTREMREPDFVRLSSANGNVLLVFQAMNTTAYLAQDYIKNFDNFIDNSRIDYGVKCSSLNVYREHVGTCSVLLNGLNGYPLNPISEDDAQPTNGNVSEKYFIETSSKVPSASAKSLGSSDPLTSRPNLLFLNYTSLASPKAGSAPMYPWGINRGYHLEISARHVVHLWTATKSMSLIPDLTWTGQDWMIVSPTQCRLSSDTGTIIVNGGLTYLVDPTFYFGQGSTVAVDGNFLLNTIEKVYFPSTGTTHLVTAVSEHVVQVLSPPAIGSGTNVNWSAVASGVPGTLPGAGNSMDTHLKNLSFRVAANGDLIQGSSRLTDAFQHNWDAVGKRFSTSHAQTVSRRALNPAGTGVSTGGANLPMSYGQLVPFYQDGGAFGDYIGYDGLAYPTSRISGDIGFSGAAAGAPKPYGISLLDDCPMLAIAWGESFYALVDRLDSGSTSTLTSQVAVFRQSMGPYQASAKDLRVISNKSVQYDWSGYGPYILHPETRRHVLTRFGLPASASTGFATDGYRNCYVYPKQVATPSMKFSDTPITGSQFDARQYLTPYVPGISMFPDNSHKIRWYSKVTNHVGDGGIEAEGPQCFYRSATEQISMPINSEALLAGDPAAYVNYTAYHNPSSPVVFWNGQRFVAFWTEEIRSANNAGIVGTINMASFVNGEETYRLDSSLGSLHDVVRNQISIATISAGVGMSVNPGLGYVYPKLDPEVGQVYVCDVAFSGDSYCVVWVAGVSIGGATATQKVYSSNVIGLSFFSEGSGNPGGRTTVLFSDAAGGSTSLSYRTPKIVWDGHNYIVFYVNPDPEGYLTTFTVPKDGIGSNLRVVRTSNSLVSPDPDYRKGSIGTLKAQMSMSLGSHYNMQGGIQMRDPVGPGDTIVIQKTLNPVVLSSNPSAAITTNGQSFVATGGVAGFAGNGEGPSSGVAQTEFHPNVTTSNTLKLIPPPGPGFLDLVAAGMVVGTRLWIYNATTGGQGANGISYFTVTGFVDNYEVSVAEPVPSPYLGGYFNGYWGFDNRPRPGDIIRINSPANLAGDYTITSWTPTSFLNFGVDRELPAYTGTASWQVIHYTENTELAGSYEVVNYNPNFGLAVLGFKNFFNKFHDQIVIGMVLSGGQPAGNGVYGGPVGTALVAPDAPIVTSGNAPAISPNSFSGYSLQTATPGTATLASRLLDVVYAKEDDTFTFLYLDGANFLWIEKWNRVDSYVLYRKRLRSFGNILSGALGWNGHHYLVWLNWSNNITYHLMSDKLVVLEDQTSHFPAAADPNQCVFGNGVNQIPGPLYGSYIPESAQIWNGLGAGYVGGALQPRPRKVEIKWNDKSGRWVVTASFLWAMEGPEGRDFRSATRAVDYINSTPSQQQYNSYQNGLIRFTRRVYADLPNNPVTGHSGRVITGIFYLPLVQPGMRVIFRTGTGAGADQPPYWFDVGMNVLGPASGVTTDLLNHPAPYYTALTVDVDSSELDAGQQALVTAVHTHVYIVPREDVITWTYSYGSPAVLVQDADSVSLTNVDISGSYVDIAEEYNLAAKPIWRSAGEIVGNPNVYRSLGNTGARFLSGTVHKRDYTRSFLSPVGKIDTLQLSNVKSRSLVKYGGNPEPDNPRIFPGSKRRS